MKLHNLKKAWDTEVEKWLFENVPELTSYQRQKIKDKEIVRFAPFEFYIRKKKVERKWYVRLTIIAIPFVWLALIITIPFRFIATGQWGYNHKSISWYLNWCHAIGL